MSRSTVVIRPRQRVVNTPQPPYAVVWMLIDLGAGPEWVAIATVGR